MFPSSDTRQLMLSERIMNANNAGTVAMEVKYLPGTDTTAILLTRKSHPVLFFTLGNPAQPRTLTMGEIFSPETATSAVREELQMSKARWRKV